MSTAASPTYTAFARHRKLASGPGPLVAQAAAQAMQCGESHVLVFDDASGDQVELSLAGLEAAIAPRSPPEKPSRGRPKLGVVAREVTLLPRHWTWLAGQPGGASAALRRLVEAASRSAERDPRQTQETVYRVMSALAGDLEGFEEASRALFAGRREGLDEIVSGWPADVRDYLRRLAA